ncbi:MAG TPA: alpha/beta fold hydrolase [Bradyrhizobium sp.]|uniref:alpha/beta fold hydrolase n=1 Tax=Bradyrhizobium sp. TaxID=376 RepID=UPI002B902C43|nr:alpha/beta fold hydrolase [Bradyrhizobium sp.]HLZ02927.1 alpha/beta fold hydrolase [Bradyrhizobium sp.]
MDSASDVAGTFGYHQFSLIDALRCMQGDALAALGYGAIESPHRIIESGSFWRLRAYGSSDEGRPVLIVPAPIKRAYVWDLTPRVSVIRECLRSGLRVFMLEWLPASDATCNIGIADHVEAIAHALETVESRSHHEKPVLMGHSLGGTLAAIAAATVPDFVAGLVLLASPICFRANGSSFRDALVALVPAPVSDSKPYPGSMLSQVSAMASPETFIWSRLADAALSAADDSAMDIHARIERWALDEVALPGRLVSEIVDRLYRENRFCRGILQVGERIIGAANLASPTLAVVNTADRVAPLDSLSPIAEALGSDQFRIIEHPGENGVCLQHLGVLVGRQAHAEVWPKIIEWIRT